MQKNWKNKLTALLLTIPMSFAFASGSHHYEKVNIDLGDMVSLQRGAQIFTNYCLSCHSASGLRYNRLRDIGLSEDDIRKNLMFTTDKIGNTMVSSMNPHDAAKWLGSTPPDLTLIARSRGADYLYAYLRGFYQDPSRPSGWNNTVFDKVGMPNPLWKQQGIKAVELDKNGQPVWVKNEHTGELEPKIYWKNTGSMTQLLPNGHVSEKEFNEYTRDLVNFLVYMGEPGQLKRKQIGYVVLLFLLTIMLPLTYFLKKEYWKDVH